jgi:hypothetical protein
MPRRHHNRECFEPAPQLILDTCRRFSNHPWQLTSDKKRAAHKKTGGTLWMPPVCFFSTFCSQANQRWQEKPLSQ